ncbi:hypothetical protein RI129_008826 [Pyrocoelia pectoralis]|uniref:BRCT domain-containing protein n=1 Tax=Pyrocoelia pectoralis TaxID=417401 RepID=A0AAN7VEV2_9COLE
MLPTNRRISSATYSPEESTETAAKSSDEILFETLMNDPIKKAFLLNILAEEKDNIKKYKKREGIVNKTPSKIQARTYCESPTALLRRRALQRNQDSDSSLTPHSSPTPSTPTDFGELLKDVVAYVEIRSKGTDRSAGPKMLMQSMGATVVDVLNRKVTHVVFKDGSFSTYQKAKLLKVHLVSILWLEAIRTTSTRVSEKNYPALGTESYDVDVTVLYQDYENIVRDEQRRSLGASSQRSLFHSQKRSRLTMLPNELRTSNQRITGKDRFSSMGRVSNVIPSSQEFETESIISCKSTVGSERPNSATLLYSNEQENIEITSDDDSECGVINGHSISQVRDSLISALDSQLSHHQEQMNTNNNRFSKSSSTPSESLLSRKSLTKTNNMVVDMELTGRPSSASLGDICNQVENNVLPHSHRSSENKIIEDSFKNHSAPCVLLGDNNMSLLHSKSGKRKSSETMPSLRISSDSTSIQHDLPSRKISMGSGPELRNRSNNSNSLKEKVRSESSTHRRICAPFSKEINNSANTDDMPPLRISTESEAELRNKKVRSRSSSGHRLSKEVNSFANSDNIPSLRMSPESEEELWDKISNSNLLKEKVGSESSTHRRTRSSCRLSKEINTSTTTNNLLAVNQELKSNTRRRTVNSAVRAHSSEIVNNNTYNSGSIAAMPLHRTANEEDNNDLSNVKHRNVIRTHSTNKLCDVHNVEQNLHIRKVSSDTALIRTSANLLKKKPLTENEILGDSRPASQKSETEVGGKKKLRKLFNLNQAIDSATELTDVVESQPEPIVNSKMLIVSLPRLSLDGKVKPTKLSKNLIVFPIRKKKKQTAKRKLKNVMRSVKNLITNSEHVKKKTESQSNVRPRKALFRDQSDTSSDDQYECSQNPRHSIRIQNSQLGNDRKRLRNMELNDKENVQNQDSDQSESPPKQQSSTIRIQSSQSHISSQLQNRRSTLEFLTKPVIKSQRTQNLKRIKASIVCTRFHKPDVQLFIQIVRKLGVFFVEDEVSKKTTHLVVGESKRTINLLRAICRGCWILKQEWLLGSLEAGKWLPEEDYELINFSPAVQQCRRERQVFGKLYCMDIFSDCGAIYVSRNSTPRKSDIEELIGLCKGTIVKEVYHAKIIVGDWIRCENIICVNERWILDSISLNKKKSFKKYLLKSV